MYRFAFVVFLLAPVMLAVQGGNAETFTKGNEQRPLTPELKTGDYVWKPEVSPAGAVVIIVSLPEQTLYVYRNGVRIGRSTISSGKSGHHTPTGVFTILEKNVKHHSSIYKGASMPYQERITWDGVAMHAGQLPGFPASHGCVRLPLDFSQKLYTVTDRGTTVVITDAKAAPGTTGNPGLLLSGKTGETTTSLGSAGFNWNPEKAPSGPVSIMFSSADNVAYVYRDGVEIGRAAVAGVDNFSGSHAYTALATINSTGNHDWQSLGSANGEPSPDLKQLGKNLVIAPEFLSQVRALVAPGTAMIITDQPVNWTTHSDPGFKILTTENSTQ